MCLYPSKPFYAIGPDCQTILSEFVFFSGSVCEQFFYNYTNWPVVREWYKVPPWVVKTYFLICQTYWRSESLFIMFNNRKLWFGVEAVPDWARMSISCVFWQAGGNRQAPQHMCAWTLKVRRIVLDKSMLHFFVADCYIHIQSTSHLTLSPLAVNFEDCWRPLQNNLDPDEAPQNVGLHLRSKLFDIQIIYRQKKWIETMDFLKILKETNIWKNYPACKELMQTTNNTQSCNMCLLF